MQNNLIQLSGIDLIVPIHGIEGAKAYPLGPNCRAPLFDDTEDILDGNDTKNNKNTNKNTMDNTKNNN